jgi:integrase/recombinase XerD
MYSTKIEIQVIGRKILLKMPKNEQDIQLIRSIPYVRWNKSAFHWEIPHYPGNLEKILTYFGDRVHSITKSEEIPVNLKSHSTLQKNQVLMIRTNSGRIKLIFGYLTELIKYIKTIPYHHWDSKNKWWTIPYSEQFEEEIKRKIVELGLRWKFEQEEKSGVIPKASPKLFDTYKKCPEEYIHKLEERRYSPQTIKTYTALFTEFINYFPHQDLDELTDKEVMDFSRYLVTTRKVSASYQNQAINAIKFYFEKVKGGPRKFYNIDRPQREKILPQVCSEEEIVSIFKSTENLKHRTILMTIYSAGLRISELINLKIAHIDSHRMQIRVVQSKGKKDRYTLLSHKNLKLLREYMRAYKPHEYLFEGQTSTRQLPIPYTSRSIQAFLKESVKKAGISKNVTAHTLRHSFATHLLEHGTDLRYIQSLLGHESSKTTVPIAIGITHITTKGFDQIVSPLDQLNLDD